ncbi:MAG: hypothetical protein JW863_11900 [Chitinispirillaceae bacterium]|nr:hypothetical protein [Chitinispirillaceae bacterium]
MFPFRPVRQNIYSNEEMIMADSFARTLYPALYAKLEKKKQAARDEPLSMADINMLLSMRFNNEPLYPSIEDFYSGEYTTALNNGTPPAELEKITRFRKPTDTELNLLYCDIHEREEKMQYSGSNQGDS